MELETHRWTRLEYVRLVDAEILGPEHRVELLGGVMVCKEPQYRPHATGISLVQHALTTALGDGWYVRAQMPLALDDDSEPEPDVAVVAGDVRDYRDTHPARALLVVEVAQWRLGFVAAGNSMGFHAPQELARILAEVIGYARPGQLGADRAARKK